MAPNASPQPNADNITPALRLHNVQPDYVLASWMNVFCAAWLRETTKAGVEDLHRRCQLFARKSANSVFYLAVVAEKAPPPDGPARAALSAFLQDGKSFLLAGAVLWDGVGVRAAMVRGVATGLVMLANPPFPFRVCSLESAASLFAEKARLRGQSFDTLGFTAGYQSLRATLARNAASPQSDVLPTPPGSPRR
jgi:hypothetical protein